MKATVKGTTLILEIPISKKPSASGKSIVIATTGGNKESELQIDGKPVIIGVNAYIKADKA